MEGLAELRDEFAIVGDVRGKGLMIGVEMVVDKESKTPLPGDQVEWKESSSLPAGLIGVICFMQDEIVTKNCGIDLSRFKGRFGVGAGNVRPYRMVFIIGSISIFQMMAIWEECREMGLLLGKGGFYGNVFRIKPPMCITMEDVEFALEVIRFALKKHAKNIA